MNPKTLECDLCHSSKFKLLIENTRQTSLGSGSTILSSKLSKISCLGCGLVRNTALPSEKQLLNFYKYSYQYNQVKGGNEEEHYFFIRGKKTARSRHFYNWIREFCPSAVLKASRRILEVGCGQGNLLAQMKRLGPKEFSGIELNQRSAAFAREKGLKVTSGPLSDLPDGYFDFIYAIGVLEHVFSPMDFLLTAGRKIKSGGFLLIAQPTLDRPSYDIFYSDHLFHFGTKHIEYYARSTGFRMQKKEIGYPMIPNFSMHLLQKTDKQISSRIRPVITTAQKTISQYRQVFADVNQALVKHGKLKLAVFGLSNIFSLLYVNTNLSKANNLICGVDDMAAKLQNSWWWPFPVLTPDEARKLNPDMLYVCINPAYHGEVIPRLEKLGFDIFNCLRKL